MLDHVRVAALLVALSACTDGATSFAPEACTASKLAEIPLSAERGFVTAPALIDDKPVAMIVDTGAELLQVTPSTVASLSLARDPRRRTTLQGVGGALVSQNAILQSFSLGGMEALDQSAAVAPLPVLAGPSLHAAGLIGAEWLSDYDVDLDLPHRRLALYSVHNCGRDFTPWPRPAASVHFQPYGRGLPLVPVTLDGTPMTALLDSGAARSVLTQAAAQRLGLTAAQLAHDREARGTGVDGNVQSLAMHTFGELMVGGTKVANPVLAVTALHLATADMLLGDDWLRRNRIWIDYASHRIGIQPSK